MQRTWLVTGSSRGLGRALAEKILDAGDNLLATARNPAALDGLNTGRPGQLVATKLDVTEPEQADAAVRLAIEHFGRLDMLVNNAGFGNIGSVEDTSLVDVRREIETNLFGTIIMTKAAIPHMRAQRSGHIIQLSSVGGRLGAPGRSAYSAAKWGVEGFSEVLKREMELIGVRVTIVEPGGFRTDFAGTSTTIRNGRPEYDAEVGVAARMQHIYNGKQPGDPKRAAEVIFSIPGMDNPPLRLALGTDAVGAIEAANKARRDELLSWQNLSRTTDFPSD
ncbi:SDR family NAD(P)-dependent oxidoreductase [Martelella alba]|uniref:SDR family NAD(P)-dependent oxidoreductase n=1 Tax=Martelella alba TaxID=2590451 RepID=A0A506UES8_9HYPH|nr:SDR family NAD(P)-dependent oxidoreductase [Martelella alba]TPW31395.1 SDR family NAD(P)-dependent oxidoreductase [Martelella alba]